MSPSTACVQPRVVRGDDRVRAEACAVEWFSCVAWCGLTPSAKIKGKWSCNACSAERRRREEARIEKRSKRRNKQTHDRDRRHTTRTCVGRLTRVGRRHVVYSCVTYCWTCLVDRRVSSPALSCRHPQEQRVGRFHRALRGSSPSACVWLSWPYRSTLRVPAVPRAPPFAVHGENRVFQFRVQPTCRRRFARLGFLRVARGLAAAVQDVVQTLPRALLHRELLVRRLASGGVQSRRRATTRRRKSSLSPRVPGVAQTLVVHHAKQIRARVLPRRRRRLSQPPPLQERVSGAGDVPRSVTLVHQPRASCARLVHVLGRGVESRASCARAAALRLAATRGAPRPGEDPRGNA